MNNYWLDRVKKEEANTHIKALDLVKELEIEYKKSFESIRNSINDLEINIRNDKNDIDMLEANKLISAKDRKELHSKLKNNLKSYRQLAKSIDYKEVKDGNAIEIHKLRELRILGNKARLSRLEATKLEINAELEMLARKKEYMLTNHLEDVYEDTYYKTAYLESNITGTEKIINKLDKSTINTAIKKVWVADGKNFSDRIWNNTTKLAQDLTKDLTIAIITGKSNLAKDLTKRYNVSMAQANRLVQTETSAIRNQATMKRYEDSGIDKYQVIATLDSHTSDICKSMDKKIFETKDKQIGINYPPFHINCRSTTIAYFPEIMDEKEVKPKTSYKEWEDKFVKPVENKLKTNKENVIINPKSDILKELKKSNIEFNKVKKLESHLTNEEIVKKISGGDLTEGSCASLSLTYVGNKIGYDVIDYRGGESRKYFSRNFFKLKNLENLKTWSEKSVNDYEAVNKLLLNMEFDKEYCLVTGSHAAIIRKIINDGGFKEYQYLELQAADYNINKFHKLTTERLKNRFGCVKTHTLKYIGKYEVESMLIDIESFKNNEEFEEILGYINTDVDKQQKGEEGHEK